MGAEMGATIHHVPPPAPHQGSRANQITERLNPHPTNGWDVASQGVQVMGQQLQRRADGPQKPPRPRASWVAIAGLVTAGFAVVGVLGLGIWQLIHELAGDSELKSTLTTQNTELSDLKQRVNAVESGLAAQSAQLDAINQRMGRIEAGQESQLQLLQSVALATNARRP